MRFSAFSVGILACSATASVLKSSLVIRDGSTLTERDAATVTNVLNDVGSGVENLDSAVQSYDGSDYSPVVDASQALLGTIQDGKTTVDGSENLSLADSLALQGPVEELTDKVHTLADNLKGKKETIQEAGECSTTRELITNINGASQDLIDSVISKVPPAARPIAENLASDLRNILDDLQSAFSETGCVDSGNGGPTPEPTSEPTSGPTSGPISESTAEPTAEPTPEPSSEPISEPTTGPTLEPTVVPTTEPSRSTPEPTDQAPTSSAIEPPVNGTATDIGPVPTAGANVLGPLGAVGLLLAAAVL
jgi:hypothetical protein